MRDGDEMNGKEILALPMQPNDSGATSVRGYLVALLLEVWQEQEGFSGKRPFGNSGWSADLWRPLIQAGLIPSASIKIEDGSGYHEIVTDDWRKTSAEADELIFSAIEALREA